MSYVLHWKSIKSEYIFNYYYLSSVDLVEGADRVFGKEKVFKIKCNVQNMQIILSPGRRGLQQMHLDRHPPRNFDPIRDRQPCRSFILHALVLGVHWTPMEVEV